MASDHRLTWCMESLVRQRACPDPEEGHSAAQSGAGGEGIAGDAPALLDDYEILAVDDCSTDGSWRILQTYAARYPGLVRAYRGDRNRRQGGAKNQALAHASGEWIAFIDADDWVVPDYFARLLWKAQETGADCVGTDYCIVHEHTMTPGPVVANSRAEQAGVVSDEGRRSMLVDFGSLCVKIYRREIVLGDQDASSERLCVFPEDIFYEDNAVVKTWVMRIRHFEYVPGPLYYYYQHDDSTVHTVSLRRLEDRKVSGRLMIEEAHRLGYLEAYKPEIEYSYTVLFYKNTLFGAMQSLRREEVKKAGASEYRTVYGFVTALSAEMKQVFPEFQENTYYRARTDAEEKKLIAMQMRSPRQFYVYYRLLWLYRKLRYGRR